MQRRFLLAAALAAAARGVVAAWDDRDVAGLTELERAFEGQLGTVLSADSRLCVPLRQRHAKRYTRTGTQSRPVER